MGSIADEQCRQGDIQAAIIGCGGCLGEGLVHGRDIVSAAAWLWLPTAGAGAMGGCCAGPRDPRWPGGCSSTVVPDRLQYEDLF
jgi:hypothetical protein